MRGPVIATPMTELSDDQRCAFHISFRHVNALHRVRFWAKLWTQKNRRWRSAVSRQLASPPRCSKQTRLRLCRCPGKSPDTNNRRTFKPEKKLLGAKGIASPFIQSSQSVAVEESATTSVLGFAEKEELTPTPDPATAPVVPPVDSSVVGVGGFEDLTDQRLMKELHI